MGKADASTLCVAVGSGNPAKVEAVRTAFNELGFGAFEVRPVPVPGGEAQPWGETATREGALRRARAALDGAGADWGIGLEAGLVQDEHGVLVTSWVTACRGGDDPGLIRTAGFYLPAAIAAHVLAGVELAAAWRQEAGLADVGRGGGTVSLLTGGRFDRTRLYRDAVVLAVARVRANDV